MSWLPFSLFDASGLEAITAKAWASISNSQLQCHPPHLPPSLNQASMTFLSKMRSRWQLIEKQQFAFDKGVL